MSPPLDALARRLAPGLTPSVAALVLRLGAGLLLLLFHARGKLVHFDEEALYFPDPFGMGHRPSLVLALITEGVGAVLLIVGLLTRPAALALAATMATVLLVAAQGDSHADVQLALVYAVPFVGTLLLGPGRWSLDHRLAPRWPALAWPLEPDRLTPSSDPPDPSASPAR